MYLFAEEKETVKIETAKVSEINKQWTKMLRKTGRE